MENADVINLANPIHLLIQPPQAEPIIQNLSPPLMVRKFLG